jgi:hypothetical protein
MKSPSATQIRPLRLHPGPKPAAAIALRPAATLAPSRLLAACIHRRRLCRWAYASFTLFAIFAVVMVFFGLSKSQDGSGSADSAANSSGEALTDAELFLQWTIVFYPSPVVLAWLLVYPGRLLPCPRARWLWETHRCAFNLLLASLAVAVAYLAVLKWVGLSFNSGPKRNTGIITGVCVFGLVALDVAAEHKARRRRGRPDRQRELRTPRQSVELEPEDCPQPSPTDAGEPNGFVEGSMQRHCSREEQHKEQQETLEPTSFGVKPIAFDKQQATAM